MPRIEVYLSEEELAYVKDKGRGWLRRVVRHQMALGDDSERRDGGDEVGKNEV